MGIVTGPDFGQFCHKVKVTVSDNYCIPNRKPIEVASCALLPPPQKMHSAVDVLLCTASILNICLISLDRYWSITKAVEYIRVSEVGRTELSSRQVREYNVGRPLVCDVLSSFGSYVYHFGCTVAT